MASYRIEYQKGVLKDFRRLPSEVKNRLERAIDQLAEEPFPVGHQKIKGSEGLFRIRVGDYRVLYEVVDSILTVFIVKAGHRKDIYR